MKSSQVQIGGRYQARISGQIVGVEVLAEKQRLSTSRRWGGGPRKSCMVPCFQVMNLRTGRKIIMSAGRIRPVPVTASEDRAARAVQRRVLWSVARSMALQAGKTDAEATSSAEDHSPGACPDRLGKPVPEAAAEPEKAGWIIRDMFGRTLKHLRDDGSAIGTSGAEEAAPEAAVDVQPPAETRGVVRVARNEEKGGIEVIFPAVPPAEVRADLKAYGFRWSRRYGCWWAREQGGMVDAITSLLGAYQERGMIQAVATS